MPRLGDIAFKVRSKNAGPFTVTIDIFCGSRQTFKTVCMQLSSQAVGEIYAAPPESVRRFEVPDLNAVKFSLPRPDIQGSRLDRDMHAAQFAELLQEFVINTE